MHPTAALVFGVLVAMTPVVGGAQQSRSPHVDLIAKHPRSMPAAVGAQGSRSLHGIVAEDFVLATGPAPTPAETSEPHDSKSVVLAGLLSGVVPGAGQVYAEAPFWRAALYAGLEAIGWTAYIATNARGSDLTEEFERYADDHWSVVRYIEWLAGNYTRWSDSAVNKDVVRDALSRIYTTTDTQRPEWERVDFEQLNRIERAVRGGFSHTLPSHGHQQYYEEIGKYVQYRAGWDDHRRDGDTLVYDPTHVTERNDEYMGMRAEANDYLGYASTALAGLLLNHLASSLDAVLTARSFNASIRADLEGNVLDDPLHPLRATLHLTVRF